MGRTLDRTLDRTAPTFCWARLRRGWCIIVLWNNILMWWYIRLRVSIATVVDDTCRHLGLLCGERKRHPLVIFCKILLWAVCYFLKRHYYYFVFDEQFKHNAWFLNWYNYSSCTQFVILWLMFHLCCCWTPC